MYSQLTAAPKNGTITLRERDSTSQLIGQTDAVLDVIAELVKGSVDWAGASSRLEAYSGVQDVE